jgi:hypothetical protein
VEAIFGLRSRERGKPAAPAKGRAHLYHKDLGGWKGCQNVHRGGFASNGEKEREGGFMGVTRAPCPSSRGSRRVV